jgi:two-component system, response regulator, stage 0 sporulation protein A
MKESKINIIIVDNSIEFCNILNDYLLNQRDIVVSGIAQNGVEALKLIQEKKPDLVVLDIIIPQLDGFETLNRLNAMDIDPMPHIIVLSALSQNKIIQRAIALGADHYIVKPFVLDVFVNRIREMFNKTIDSNGIKKHLLIMKNTESKINKSQSIDMINKISDIIHEIGIPDHMKGCMYLKEAISMELNDTKLSSPVTKKLYPLISKKFYTTAGRVERTINQAIDVAWSKGQVQTINNKKGKPTNCEFIAMLVYKLRLVNKVISLVFLCSPLLFQIGAELASV